jgi:hypothetical protein
VRCGVEIGPPTRSVPVYDGQAGDAGEGRHLWKERPDGAPDHRLRCFEPVATLLHSNWRSQGRFPKWWQVYPWSHQTAGAGRQTTVCYSVGGPFRKWLGRGRYAAYKLGQGIYNLRPKSVHLDGVPGLTDLHPSWECGMDNRALALTTAYMRSADGFAL